MHVFVLATTAFVVSHAFGPMSLAGEPESSLITIRATQDGIVIESTDQLTETTSNRCDKSGKCGDRSKCGDSRECGENYACEEKCAFGQNSKCGESCVCDDGCGQGECGDRMTCHGLAFQLPPVLPKLPIAIPPPFHPNPFVTGFRVWSAKHQDAVRPERAGPPRIQGYQPIAQATQNTPIPPCVLTPAVSHERPIAQTPELPRIPDSLTPEHGSVVEYWPSGEIKSEREFRDGRVTTAVYYASDGTVVFEMESDDS